MRFLESVCLTASDRATTCLPAALASVKPTWGGKGETTVYVSDHLWCLREERGKQLDYNTKQHLINSVLNKNPQQGST